MESVRFDRQTGQILVQVALMVVVLFAFVALALDVGQVYAGRRRMQNAADAGALAGAQAICFEGASEAQAMDVARDYAVVNGAQDPDVLILQDYTVVVTAGRTLDTFFAGLIGINTADVRAEAAARCGPSSAAGGSWPLAFNYSVYTNSVGCGDSFMVFESKDVFEMNEDGEFVYKEDLGCAHLCPEDECPSGCTCASVTGVDLDKKDPCYDKADCSLFGPHLANANRGWLDFPRPKSLDEPYDVPEDCVESSGVPWIECWIDNEFPVKISVGDCVRGESGNMTSLESIVNKHQGEYVSIILWDRECDENDPEPLGQQGTPYHVAGFGCIEIIEYDTDYDIYKCGVAEPSKSDGVPGYKGLNVIKAKRICPPNPDTGFGGNEGWDQCRVPGATTGGGDPTQPWTPSLIQWPRADD